VVTGSNFGENQGRQAYGENKPQGERTVRGGGSQYTSRSQGGGRPYQSKDSKSDNRNSSTGREGKPHQKREEGSHQRREGSSYQGKSDRPYQKREEGSYQRREGSSYQGKSDRPYQKREEGSYQRREGSSYQGRSDRPYQKREEGSYQRREGSSYQGRSDKPYQKREGNSYQGKSDRSYQNRGSYGGDSRGGYKPRDNRGFNREDPDGEYEPVVYAKKKPAAAKDKPKDANPEKAVVINRLEKEKKVMKKKTDTNKKGKNASTKPQVRVKRANNIDWTKEYENDSYDDDDAFYNY
jgi:hypothetical protein